MGGSVFVILLIALAAVLFVSGLSVFVAVPVFLVVVVGVGVWLRVFASASGRSAPTSDVPSTREASYEPVIDPSDRP